MGLFVGLVIGIICAATVVWYIQKTPAPFVNRGIRTASQDVANANQEPRPIPPKPGVDPGRARFDFYRILPGTDAEPVVAQRPDEARPVTDPRQVANEQGRAEKERQAREVVFLQTGSFQNPHDADNQRARLAMMGVESSVVQVMLQDNVWYRVRIGPFAKTEEANTMRAKLSKQGWQTTIVR